MSTAQLPPEIWRLILRQATYVRDLLSTTWDYSPEERIWEGWEDEIDGLPALGMDTKRAIVQVCRGWRDIGVEFLYEAIHITSHEEYRNQLQLEKLVEAFKESAVASSTGRGYGWWTKRVLCLHQDLSSIHVTLFSLLEQCYNIQIFSVRWDILAARTFLPHLQVRLSLLLHSRFSHSLRRAELYIDAGNPPHPDVIPRMVGMTSLGVMVRNDTLDPPDSSSFDLITTLTIVIPAFLDTFHAQWNFPSLRSLSLQNVFPRDVGPLIPFFNRHRNQLLHLHISTAGVLPSLLSSITNIHSLAFDQLDLEELEWWGDLNPSLPNLTHLRVNCRPYDPDEHYPLTFIVRQALEARFFPNLAVIRLLNESKIVSSESDRKSAAMLCNSRDVRLEGRQGQPINIGMV